MKYGILFILSVIPVVIGCKDEEPDTMDFPIIRTLPIADIDSSGATFRCEVIKKGSIPTISYGFIWSMVEPIVGETNKVLLGEDINSGTFEARIDHALSGNVDYKVRAFAKFADQTVYSNIDSFKSVGSAHCPWSLEMTGVFFEGAWGGTLGFTNGESGAVIFQSNYVYVFDPDKKEFLKSVNFPLPGNSGAKFTAAIHGNNQYFFNNINNILYKYEAGLWSQQSTIPFTYGYFEGYYQGFALSDSIYILSSDQSYMYNIKANTWQRKAVVPMYSVGGAEDSGKAYIVTADKSVWEYNIYTDNWIKKTIFPGILKQKIVSFSYDNKIYFGLSYFHYTVEKNAMDRQFWMYDPTLDEWKMLEKFPVDYNAEDLFFFCIKGYMYVGFWIRGKYDLWKFDPSKI
jgi:hypothetical protein